MSRLFFEASKRIANNFLQNIVFIDDKAYLEEERNSHEFNAFQITQAFANSKKICAIYKPETLADIDILAQLAKKADITVIDWQLNINENEGQENSEEDAEEDDPRGPHTRRIIREILLDPLIGQGSLKLILIYTGEIGLYDITDEIFKDLHEQGIENIQKDECRVFTDNFTILVVAKPNIEGTSEKDKFKHNPKLNEKIVSYEDLPDFILEEFTKMTSGLLSNFVLQSLTTLRRNTFTLLNTFNKKLDPAFLAHKALLRTPNDAFDQILNIIGSEIKSLLISYNALDAISDESIKQYIDNTIAEGELTFELPEMDKFKKIQLPKTVNRDLLAQFCEKGIERLLIPKDSPSHESRLFSDVCYKVLTKYYLHGTITEDESNRKLALLTTLKSVYNKEFEPLLTLGTIVFHSDEYWICITPKCDCTGIKRNRNILFTRLKLVEKSDSFDFILMKENDYFHFKIQYSIHRTRFFELKSNGDGAIGAKLNEGKLEFKGNSILEWVGELKSDFAQSVANNFSSQLARVGMDHSEWLRRS